MLEKSLTPSYHLTHLPTSSTTTAIKHDTICQAIGGTCSPVVDGYFVEVITCGIFGFFYFLLLWPKLRHLDTLPLSSWRSSK
jgi:hypothetical protein